MKIKKTVYLQNNKGEWKSFKFETTKDIRKILEDDGYSAKIGDYAKIGDSAKIGYSAKIGDYAKIGYYAKIGDSAKIGDYAEFKKSPLYIIGSRYAVNYYGNKKICIGCFVLTFAEWKGKKGKEIAKKEGYTKAEIDEYKMHIDLIVKRYK